ncbi:hypothetical protein HWC59_gp35 [Proteus phage Myduc]|uniref:Uncharacterized protein n=1 Tax=Proteus phage Myduc TaxID=2650874 RepID=A0A5J6T8H8_9CAUD|nr:hypothetical protein HWC59_gp35 [Proteus phage Myduc]QFG06702.1 hypothetical protein CPT_Myduc_080 [Proteus phage Myduc]
MDFDWFCVDMLVLRLVGNVVGSYMLREDGSR